MWVRKLAIPIKFGFRKAADFEPASGRFPPVPNDGTIFVSCYGQCRGPLIRSVIASVLIIAVALHIGAVLEFPARRRVHGKAAAN
jgi:hypothetical protein